MRRKQVVLTTIVAGIVFASGVFWLVTEVWFADDNAEPTTVYMMPSNRAKATWQSQPSLLDTATSSPVNLIDPLTETEDELTISDDDSSVHAEIADLQRQAADAMQHFHDSKTEAAARAANIDDLERRIADSNFAIAANYEKLRSTGYRNLSKGEIEDAFLDALLDYQGKNPDLQNASYEEVLQALKADSARLFGD